MSQMLFQQLSEANQLRLIDKYLQQMTSIEKKTYEIAKEHLESSFSLEKSIGFMKYCEEELNIEE
jgi:hypothetical protein